MRFLLAFLVIGSFLSAQDPPQGVPARQRASDYASEATYRSATFAASLVSAKQVEHLFAFDISKSYLVFEVACFADSSADLNLSRAAFTVKLHALGDAVHNAEPGTVASVIQRGNLPSLPSSSNTHVVTSANVGFEHGTDPYTGRPENGVYTGGSVGVEHGGPDSGSPPPDPKPGGTPEDRRMLEAQLLARSLPEGPVHHTVAGYLFFRKSDLKTQADGTYALEYSVDSDGNAPQVVTLAIPKKAR